MLRYKDTRARGGNSYSTPVGCLNRRAEGAIFFFLLFSPKAEKVFLVHFLEGNGLFWEIVVGKIDFSYNFCRFLAIFHESPYGPLKPEATRPRSGRRHQKPAAQAI